MSPGNDFWNGKRVLITGHQGFKGRWLSEWMRGLGARVSGYDIQNDITNEVNVKKAVKAIKPDIVFHLAAQPLVIDGFKYPSKTFNTNISGTNNLLNACREYPPKSIIVVTSDKVYKNHEHLNKETDELGGVCPYSISKACAEMVAKSYRDAYGLPIATVRAGNVIGGGDFHESRLVPDIIFAAVTNSKLKLRNPNAVRPWLYVLDCLNGYMKLAEIIYRHQAVVYCDAWNFGPNMDSERTVSNVISQMKQYLKFETEVDTSLFLQESQTLRLDNAKAGFYLDWKPKLTFNESLEWTAKWYKAHFEGINITREQINEFTSL